MECKSHTKDKGTPKPLILKKYTTGIRWMARRGQPTQGFRQKIFLRKQNSISPYDEKEDTEAAVFRILAFYIVFCSSFVHGIS